MPCSKIVWMYITKFIKHGTNIPKLYKKAKIMQKQLFCFVTLSTKTFCLVWRKLLGYS